mgnify:CR=1 FL=1
MLLSFAKKRTKRKSPVSEKTGLRLKDSNSINIKQVLR